MLILRGIPFINSYLFELFSNKYLNNKINNCDKM